MKDVYTFDELNDHHDYAREHVVNGQRLHGGFDAGGNYIPPRTRSRAEALANWQRKLEAAGGSLFEADASLLTGPRMPNSEQQRLLLANGLTRPFWNGLTITGKIEARGRVLAEMQFPDLQQLVVEDISRMALGHLNKGLLVAHGIDEGGEPDKGIGGHDVMWFVARDLVIPPGTHPDVQPPESISRPEAGKRWMPEIAQPYEMFLSFLMNLLMIEFRAEIGFASTQQVLRAPELFTDHRAAAEDAAEIIERIRTDETIHVWGLRLVLGELRQLHVRTVDGGTMPAAPLIDRFWAGLVSWAVHEQPVLAAQTAYPALREQILDSSRGDALLDDFCKLADAGALPA
ncbi:MAG: hypothetical protein R3E84_20685 [Pseudomonadales bacterium]